MTKEAISARIEEIGIIPAVRLSSAEDALFAAEAVCSSGIPIVEVTMTVPGAVKVIHSLAGKMPDVIVGAGSVPDADAAARCLDAGARFLTTTGLDLAIVEFAVKRKVTVIPGALTPTEVLWRGEPGRTSSRFFPARRWAGQLICGPCALLSRRCALSPREE